MRLVPEQGGHPLYHRRRRRQVHALRDGPEGLLLGRSVSAGEDPTEPRAGAGEKGKVQGGDDDDEMRDEGVEEDHVGL